VFLYVYADLQMPYEAVHVRRTFYPRRLAKADDPWILLVPIPVLADHSVD